MKGKYGVVFLATSQNPYPESDKRHKVWNEGYQACDTDWRKAAGKILDQLVKEGLKEV